jgi:hypothetical protein
MTRKLDARAHTLGAALGMAACFGLMACGGAGEPARNATAPASNAAPATPANQNAGAAPAGDVGTPAQQQAVKDVDAALKKAGFTNIQVFLKSNTIQIRGTVPAGKMKEAQDIAKNAAGMNATMIEIYQENPK